MIEFEFENNGSLQMRVQCNEYDATIEFYGKNYNTHTEDFVIIKNIYFKDLILPELFLFSTMTTDNKDYASMSNVDYISFNGVWSLKFTDNDVREILRKKLT